MYKNIQTNAAKTPDTHTEVPSKVLKVPFSIILIYSGVADLGKVYPITSAAVAIEFKCSIGT